MLLNGVHTGPGSGCYGIMTRSWVEILKKHPLASYLQLMEMLGRACKDFPQTPCLSGNMRMDLLEPVVM